MPFLKALYLSVYKVVKQCILKKKYKLTVFFSEGWTFYRDWNFRVLPNRRLFLSSVRVLGGVQVRGISVLHVPLRCLGSFLLVPWTSSSANRLQQGSNSRWCQFWNAAPSLLLNPLNRASSHGKGGWTVVSLMMNVSRQLIISPKSPINLQSMNSLFS